MLAYHQTNSVNIGEMELEMGEEVKSTAINGNKWKR